MRQAQQLQNRLAQAQEELAEMTAEGSAGGGVVRVTMNGRQEVSAVVIEPEAVDDIDLLQDLVAAAVNDASTRTQQMAAEKMNALTGGMNIPGLV